MTLIILTSILAFSLIPSALAGPTGIRVRSGGGRCAAKCRKNWGWPGCSFSGDRWGPVVDPQLSPGSDDPDSGSGVAGVEAAPSSDISTPVSTGLLAAPSAYGSSSDSLIFSATISSSESSPTHKSSGSSNPNSNSTPPPPPHVNPKPAPPPPPPAPAPESPPAPVSGGSDSTSGPTSQSDIAAYLAGHNNIRAQHGAAPLTYSQDLAAKAQQWVNGCVFQHSGGKLGPFGENLAAGTGSSYGIAEALKSWTDESSQYNPNDPQPSHFTQVVWKSTTQVGCALQMCDGIFAASFGKAKYYVCEYSPQGNIIGEFSQNVQA